MQNRNALPDTERTPAALFALVKLLEESHAREWNVNFLIAIKTAAEAAGPIPYAAFAESIAFAEQVLLCRDYYSGRSPKGDLSGKHPLSLAIDSRRTSIQDRLRSDFDRAQKTRFNKERVIWMTATIRVLQRTLGQIGEVLPTCRSEIHSTIRSLDVFLCALLTAQTPCFAFAKLGDVAANAVKAKLCEDVTNLVSVVQQLERERHKELERQQESTIRSNFMAARLPPPEIPPLGGSSTGGSRFVATATPHRRRERELTAVDFAHMEAVFEIRDIYRLYKGADSYPAIAKRIFKTYRDRLTVAGIVQVTQQTLADHAKKKTWPPSRWRTAYNQKK